MNGLLYFAAVLDRFGTLGGGIGAADLGFCGPPGTRTLNPRIKSPLLCQLS